MLKLFKNFCSKTLYKPIDIQALFQRKGTNSRLDKIHSALKIQQYMKKSELDQSSPKTPGIIDAWQKTSQMNSLYLRKNKLMFIRIEADQQNQQQEVYVTNNSNLKGLTKKNQVFGQLFKIRACGQFYHTIMTSWSRDIFKYLHLAVFKRYNPGKPNQCFLILQPIGYTKNPYIGHQHYNARNAVPALRIICYNKVPPIRLKVDISYVIPDRPMYLGDIQNLLPRGCYIDPKRYGEVFFQIYRVQFMSKMRERQIQQALKKGSGKKKDQKKQKKKQASASGKEAGAGAGAAAQIQDKDSKDKSKSTKSKKK